jgi:hypothetical protein
VLKVFPPILYLYVKTIGERGGQVLYENTSFVIPPKKFSVCIYLYKNDIFLLSCLIFNRGKWGRERGINERYGK